MTDLESRNEGSALQELAIDWNWVWRKLQARKHASKRDPEFWNKRAPEFARRAMSGGYIDQFLGIVKLQPRWTVLDVGCAAGTLAVPLAATVQSVTALDASPAMLSLLEERCRREGIRNIRTVLGRWEDNWDDLGIGRHDVAIASRSLVIDDLREGILKLQSHADKRVYLSTLVDDGPHDRKILEAVGRPFHPGADYILVCNVLRQMGIYANVAFTASKQSRNFTDLEDAVDSLRWMVHEMTAEEERMLRRHLADCLVKEDGHWKLPYDRVVRWAVLWWDKANDSDQR